jgi:type I restriction enzyme S subunit
MEYKRLGDYIEPIDERNSKLEIKLSQGICNEKYFQDPRQVAENSAADKIVRRGYFAYNRATTRNGEKISIAYREGPDCTVSSAYQVFRIKDEEKLNPKYLLMWYKRSDFDRYARFRSHGSAHEFFEYEEMCDVYLPLPDIDRQREIVEEYETLSRRIHLNEQMIEKLEATAQALYRKMFVDGIDKENLPEGWRIGTLGEIAKIVTGKLNSEDAVENGIYPFFTCSQETYRTNSYAFDQEAVLLAGNNASAVYPLKIFKGRFNAYQRTYVISSMHNNVSNKQIYYAIKDKLEDFKSSSQGTTTKFLTIKILDEIPILIADTNSYIEFSTKVDVLYNSLLLYKSENSKLSELQSLLLAKMGRLKQ